MIQRFLYTTIKSGLEFFRDNPSAIETAFKDYDLPAAEITAIKDWMVSDFPAIKHQYARTDDDWPVIAIVLGSEEETDHYIGDFAAVLDDGADEVGGIWSHDYQILVCTEHPDTTMYLYELLKSAFMVADWIACGLHPVHFSGGDVAPDKRYIPDNVFVRQFTIKASKEFTYSEAETRLGKAFRIGGVHVDNTGIDSEIGDVKTLVKTY